MDSCQEQNLETLIVKQLYFYFSHLSKRSFWFQNIFDSKKKIKAATADDLEHKLTTSNYFTLLFLTAGDKYVYTEIRYRAVLVISILV